MVQELGKATKLSWRKMLISDHGNLGMLYLRDNAPKVGSAGESQNIIFRAGVTEGYALALDAIYALASAEQEANSQELEPK